VIAAYTEGKGDEVEVDDANVRCDAWVRTESEASDPVLLLGKSLKLRNADPAAVRLDRCEFRAAVSRPIHRDHGVSPIWRRNM
jgi:hypothetical protein